MSLSSPGCYIWLQTTINMQLPLEQLEESSARYNAYRNRSGRADFNLVDEKLIAKPFGKKGESEFFENNILGDKENMVKRKEMLSESSPEPLEFAFERVIGKNDSVYSNFIELLGIAKQKVGRIAIRDGIRTTGFATGFMVSSHLLLTNWHVFKTKESIAESEVQFFYEYDILGNGKQPVSFKLSIEKFYYAFKDYDYCFVGVESIDTSGQISLSSIGYIHLDLTLGKLGKEGEERVNIIHHPDGDYKQLSIRENLFTKILPFSIWYECDTSWGSSGGPVFNDQWQVVALHHSGVPKRNENKEIIDRDGDVIPIIDGKVDESRIQWIANEGIRVSVIVKDIQAKHPTHELVKELATPPGKTEAQPLSVNLPNLPSTEQKNNTMDRTVNNESKGDVKIVFPSSLIETTGVININIDNRGRESQPLNVAIKEKEMSSSETLIAEEIKKIEIEDGMDYSDCKGYVPGFLSVNIPLPMPNATLRKFITKQKINNDIILKYHHFSVLLHKVRKMPVLSAININGSPKKRLDETKRGTDVWLRDNRVDYELQLNDKYYKGSGFDRGHMSRREDANWGDTAEEAREYADLTCIYTNACPQINTINQSSRGGLWGELEKVVLENGAFEEKGKLANISVFNGPILKDSDKFFRGIQVPMEYFKIILWLNNEKKLKATAFKLSQKNLVGDIDFDEAIDLDKNVEFAKYNYSIAKLQDETQLDFSAIIPFDTFTAKEPIELNSEEEVKLLISAHASTTNKK